MADNLTMEIPAGKIRPPVNIDPWVQRYILPVPA